MGLSLFGNNNIRMDSGWRNVHVVAKCNQDPDTYPIEQKKVMDGFEWGGLRNGTTTVLVDRVELNCSQTTAVPCSEIGEILVI